MSLPGRSYNAGSYRYGFNGKENDKDISEGGQDYGLRIYDCRLGRFMSIDPLSSSFAWNSTYCFAENTPLWGIDLDGGEFKDAIKLAKTTASFLKAYTAYEVRKKTDATASSALIKFAITIYPDVEKINEATKQAQFKSNPNNSVAILLYEFATGTGKTERTFNYGEKGSFANAFIEGRVIQDVKNEFTKKMEQQTYSQFSKNGVRFGLNFSPDQTGLIESIDKHLNSNLPQFFVGGANVLVTATDDPNWVNVSITNSTSRNSLMLHQAGNYERSGNEDGKEQPLSTITQTFTFRMRIDPSKFKKESKKKKNK